MKSLDLSYRHTHTEVLAAGVSVTYVPVWHWFCDLFSISFSFTRCLFYFNYSLYAVLWHTRHARPSFSAYRFFLLLCFFQPSWEQKKVLTTTTTTTWHCSIRCMFVFCFPRGLFHSETTHFFHLCLSGKFRESKVRCHGHVWLNVIFFLQVIIILTGEHMSFFALFGMLRADAIRVSFRLLIVVLSFSWKEGNNKN